MCPPEVRCVTKLWHPNITEQGEICLSILRQNSGTIPAFLGSDSLYENGQELTFAMGWRRGGGGGWVPVFFVLNLP